MNDVYYFSQEESTPADSVAAHFARWISEGKVYCSSTMFGEEEVTSIGVRQKWQLCRRELPIGARTLLWNHAGHLVFRGMNAFGSFQLEQVAKLGWPIILQRKMAGFVLHVVSRDGITLNFIAKHTTVGLHVDLGRKILFSCTSDVQRAHLARWLFLHTLSLTGECIDVVNDSMHPELDEEFTGRFWPFAAQRYNSVVEQCISFAQLQEFCSSIGLAVVPSCLVHDEKGLQEILQPCLSWTARGEGWVLVWERMVRGEIQPVRLKLKTLRYTAQRHMRSIILGQTTPRDTPFLDCFRMWLSETHSVSSREQLLQNIGLGRVFDEFVSTMEGKGEAWTEAMVMARNQFVSPVQHIFVLLCGPPGCGKSTFAREICSTAAEAGMCKYAVHVEKDVVTSECFSDKVLSKHKMRRARGQAHWSTIGRCRDVVFFASMQHLPVLFVLDACHINAATRLSWLGTVPFTRKIVVCLAGDVQSNYVTFAERVALRKDHPTIRGVEEAQVALFKISSRFFAPTVSELDVGTELLILDTTRKSLPACVAECARFMPRAFNGKGTLVSCNDLSRSVDERKLAVSQLFSASNVGPQVTTRLVYLLPVGSAWEQPLITLLRSLPSSCRLIRGNSKWFHFIKEDLTTYLSRAENPHVTLYRGVDPMRWLESEKLDINEPFTLQVATVLLDSNALCFGVKIVTQKFNSVAVATCEHGDARACQFSHLHITWALREHFNPSYCGLMPDLFAANTTDNEEVATKKSRKEKTGRKFHNFAEVEVSPITLSGMMIVKFAK